MMQSRALKWLFIATVVMMAITGFGQMPIFKRYYIASIPGMGWTADFYLTHIMHYLGAAVFLFLITYWAAGYLRGWRERYDLTAMGAVKAALWAGVAVTGVLRVVKNLPDYTFSPTFTMLLDWVHLALVMVVGVVALAGVLLGRTRYVQERTL